MIVFVIMTIVFLLSLFLKGDTRDACIIFSVLTALHELLFMNEMGFIYLFSDALFALLMITLLKSLKPTKLIDELLRICIMIIGLSFIGYFVWLNYMSMEFINSAGIALYLYSALIVGGSNGAMGRDNRWRSFILMGID